MHQFWHSVAPDVQEMPDRMNDELWLTSMQRTTYINPHRIAPHLSGAEGLLHTLVQKALTCMVVQESTTYRESAGACCA